MTSERDFQQQVIDLARMLGWLTYHTYDSRRSNAGFPDLVLAHPKRGIRFVELKSEKGRLTPAQKEWGETLCRAGAHYYVWRPEDLETIIPNVLTGKVKPLDPAAKIIRIG